MRHDITALFHSSELKGISLPAPISKTLTNNSNQIHRPFNACLHFKMDECPKRHQQKLPSKTIWNGQPIKPSVHKVDSVHKDQQH